MIPTPDLCRRVLRWFETSFRTTRKVGTAAVRRFPNRTCCGSSSSRFGVWLPHVCTRLLCGCLVLLSRVRCEHEISECVRCTNVRSSPTASSCTCLSWVMRCAVRCILGQAERRESVSRFPRWDISAGSTQNTMSCSGLLWPFTAVTSGALFILKTPTHVYFLTTAFAPMPLALDLQNTSSLKQPACPPTF